MTFVRRYVSALIDGNHKWLQINADFELIYVDMYVHAYIYKINDPEII